MGKILNNGYLKNDFLVESAKGQYIYSAENKKYLDFGMGAGSQIFGHGNKVLGRISNNAIKKGILHNFNNVDIQLLSNKLDNILPLNNYVFCSTGTEATSRAIRYSRSATGKKIIVSFKGGWHGMNEWTLFDDGSRLGINDSLMNNCGVLNLDEKYRINLEYYDDYSLEYITKHSNEIAAIIIEPILGSIPSENNLFWLQKIYELAKLKKIVLIFDEIITGFRCGLSGIAGKLQLKPDIIVYGKILGGGLPIGLVTISDEILNKIEHNNNVVLTGGTFSCSPVIASIALNVVNSLESFNYDKINELSKKTRDDLNSIFKEKKLEITAIGYDSITRLIYTKENVNNRTQRDHFESLNLNFKNNFLLYLFNKNILIPKNGLLFLSSKHSVRDLNFFKNIISDYAI